MPCVAVIPARRAERTIRRTLESLRLANGDFVERVLVVTSADDPTAEVVRRWAARDPRVELVLSDRVRTAGRARNDGRREAETKPSSDTGSAVDRSLILFIDADCRLEAGGAAGLAREIVRTGAAAVTSRILGERGAVARARHILEFKEAAARRPAPRSWSPPSTVMLCRIDAFDRAGGFPDLWPGEDLVFVQALRDLGEIVLRSDLVTAVHRHPRGVFEMLRHQWRLGSTAAVARRMRTMRGSGFARSIALAPLLLPARMIRIGHWQLGEGRAALAWTVVLSPLLIVGLVAWTGGFVAKVAAARAQRAGAVSAATIESQANEAAAA